MDYHRRSIRLQDFDYSQNGLYFIAICVQDRKHLFGEIIGDEMKLNQFGCVAEEEWEKTATIRGNVSLDTFVIMPNHIHGIINIDRRGTMSRALKNETDNKHDNYDDVEGTKHCAPTNFESFGKPTSDSIPTIIRGYKAAVTTVIHNLSHNPGYRVWQRNYWEHVIRNGKEYLLIGKYIQENPSHWEEDKLNH